MSSASAGSSERIAGVLLAAGRSRRMGSLKQVLPWPPMRDGAIAAPATTVVASAFDGIAPFCDRMFIALGRDRAAVTAALGARRFTPVEADSDDEMFASIRAGLRAIVDHEHAAHSTLEAVLLQPGDHPGVARSTIECLLAAWRVDRAMAVMPEYRGKGGHPALIPRALLPQVLGWSDGQGGGAGGLRQFWVEHPWLRSRLAVDDRLCTVDLDTPDDYEAAFAAR
jgi:molybdenum cofactor cytidylyltransferase